MRQLIISLLIIAAACIYISCGNNSQNIIDNQSDSYSEGMNNYFIALTDVHLNSLNKGNTMFGGPYDTGDSLWIRTKVHIEQKAKLKQPKFMVYLGDLPHHLDSTRKINVSAMLENLRDLDLKIPILYLPGNNDSPGGDYHSFSVAINPGDTINTFSLNPDQSDPWPILNDSTSHVKAENVDFNNQFGYYSVDINDGGDRLKVIALNTVIFCAKSNSHYVSNDGVSQQKAASDQFKWFHKTLENTSDSDRIMIVMHIPPGNNGYKYTSYHGTMWNLDLHYKYSDTDSLNIQEAFLKEVWNKRENIVGVLTAHTHYDGLRRLFYNEDGVEEMFSTVSISTPGITIGHGNNPGFKFFEYEPKTYDILDFETYYAEATDSLRRGFFQKRFDYHLDKSYSFKETYNVNDDTLTIIEAIESMHQDSIVKNMKKILLVKSDNSSVNFDFVDALDVK